MSSKIQYRSGVILSVLLLTTITIIAFAVEQKRSYELKKIAEIERAGTPIKPKPYDKALLAKFEEVLNYLDFSKPAYTISGNISILNKADSLQNMQRIAFLICKQDSEFYYKEGNIETINQKGLYISINQQTKKVFVSAQKKINAGGFIDLDQLRKALAQENYEMKTSREQGSQTISLINEHHISCKEFDLTFDTLSNKPLRLYSRLTNLRDAVNKNKDKILDIKIQQLTNEARLDTYNTSDKVVYKTDTGWRLTEKYKGYKLVQL